MKSLHMDWPATQIEQVPFRRWFFWGLLLALLFAVLAALGWRRTFIVTESWALYFAGQPFSVQLAAIRNDLVHPPLMYLVQRAWFSAFGFSDAAAHSLPIFIATPAILLLTLLATRITSQWRLLAFFLTCLYLPIGSSASLVRMYGLALLLTTAAILLWDIWREDPRTGTLAAWTAVMTLLVYTHLFGTLIVLAFFLLNWLLGPRKWAFTVAAAVPALAFLPWFLYVLPVYHSRGLASNLSWVHQSLLSAIPSLFAGFLGAFYSNSYRVYFLGIAFASVIHLGLLVLYWRNRARFWPPRGESNSVQRWFWSAVVLGGVPILSLLAFSIVVDRAFEARFVLGAAIPYSIVIFLLCQLSGRAGRIVLLCVLLPWRIGGIANSVVKSWKPSFTRQGVEFVAAQLRPGDFLLVDSSAYGSVIYWEWNRRLRRAEPIAVLPQDSPEPALLGSVEPRPLEQMDLAGVARIWVFQRQPEVKPGLPEALAARGFLPVSRGAPRVTGLFLFERKVAN